jgi:hypothetical protein
MRRVLTQVYNALLFPSRFVGADVAWTDGSAVRDVAVVGRLLGVFGGNLVLYAVPLTLAGFGTVAESAPPPFLATIATPLGLGAAWTWDFLQRFAQNSLYISLAAALTFVAFHGSVYLTRSSTGVVPSLHTVVYSTSAYLAAVFSVVWFLSTSASVAVADTLVLNVQKRFVYAVIDATGVSLTFASGRPAPVSLADATPTDQVALAVLALTVGYFVYSLYLGSRINHGASRLTATLTVVTVASTPLVFVLGSIARALGSLPLL